MSVMLKTSGVGVMTAERMAMSKIAYLRFRVRKAAFTMLRVLIKAKIKGSSKVRPKPKMKMKQKETYFPTEIKGRRWAD